ncbi:RMD1 family protein [Candidatus Woesearchaeota archaeon]|nr:MAG: RMD1 family protein [Candidatus Woesearchaeota archaeon]
MDAYNISAEININEFYYDKYKTNKKFKWNTPCVIKRSANSYIFLYNFGAVVFVNVEEMERLGFINSLHNYLTGQRRKRTIEKFKIKIMPKAKIEVGFDEVVLPKFELDIIKLISFLLAQSVSLRQFENQVDDVLDRLYYVVEKFYETKKIRWNNKKILSMIAYAIKIRHSILSELLILDKPSVVWESSKLDTLYEQMYDMLEMEERFKALDRKLEILLENTQIITDISVSQKEIFLEWMIVALFVIDVLLFLYEIFM